MTHEKLGASSAGAKTDRDSLNRFFATQHGLGYIVNAINNDALPWRDDRDNPEWRRTMIRERFSFHEALVYQIGRLLLAAHEARLIQLSAADFSILSGGQYRLSENGEPKLRNDLIHSHTTLLFTVRLCRDYCGSARTINKRASDWKNYKIGSRIRDRVVHPRDFSDFEVTDASYSVVSQAMTWSHRLIQDLIESVRTLQAPPSDPSPE